MILFDPGLIGSALRLVVSFGVVFGVFVYIMVWSERRVSAWMQDRVGPNRVGPFGLLQSMADGIKFIFKEEVRPAKAHRILYLLAPCLAVFPAVLAFAVVPFGARRIDGVIVPLQVADIDVGILFAVSVASLGVFSILLAGWASNSKYPLLGGLRAAAQFISYEIPLGLSIVSVLLLAGSARLGDIVAMQSDSWFIFLTPLGFLLFVASIFAETNRLPFDLAEGEAEIIGYHAEYSSMKFAMFFMSEYANMVTVSCLVVLLFLGGWELLPMFGWEKLGAAIGKDIYGDPILWILPTLWFIAKVTAFLFFFIWVRWTIPRFRYDQLMALGWKRLIPLGLVNLLVTVGVAVGVSGR
ncbi:MAG TPA: NADH-quinone oxidoreductase subunit NuoH [Bdellovibrionota bacterium]|nr:NADH-quinone oxidoreductase subunit NuoH [Bdellovibrionota bacterium]